MSSSSSITNILNPTSTASLLNQPPALSVRPIYPSNNNTTKNNNTTINNNNATSSKNLINIETGKRQDNRTCDKFRNVFMQVGVIKQARGSAYMEYQNGTKVICSVYGPRQISARNEFSDIGAIQCEYRVANFAYQSSNNQSTFLNNSSNNNRRHHVENSIHLREALEVSIRLDKYPKSVIDVYCFILQDDGSALSAAISCASLALANAGIEMYDMVSACTTSELEGHIIVDPTNLEYKYASGGMVCAYMSNLNQVTQLSQVGDMSYQKIGEAMDLCIDGCSKLNQLMQQCLLNNSSTNEK
ncbi:3'-5' exoribonuclease/RNA-binding protein-like protein [Naegleria gruberi]|uniref:3'-5' exoribonuclease/RNA-binding protein-like protein n=1 Tax=Naegleria gruberi TaxID=5762 RepID=D2UZQ3_NAEGR|nr:3'-5' exoribonuclease/RNA-binding protein-like protein [Naegleria gruberi]EFC50201.1 3'-5' exoribonuclease/RNA-binding protein-like protein [Naegleria gruberi]|eukprot:XP_002682945.1 3'-5' exoribonuclease/RNA-binding protein-like protein [Naegleria gruberi strain NEG-M]